MRTFFVALALLLFPLVQNNAVAQQFFYDAMDLIKERIPDQEPIDVFQQSLDTVKPSIETQDRPYMEKPYLRRPTRTRRAAGLPPPAFT